MVNHMSAAQLLVPFHLGLLLTLGGCDLELLDDENSGSQHEQADSAHDDTGDASTTADLLLTSEECELICSEREDNLDENGLCSFEATSGDCLSSCDDYSAFQLSTQEAFATCVATDNLCYVHIDDCVAGQVYPGKTVAPVTVTATGFDAYAGEPVVLGMADSDSFVMKSAAVSGVGGFEVTWSQEILASDSRQLVFYYVDLNGDGSCDPDVDVTGSVSVERSEDIDNLSYSVLVEEPESGAGFVCDYI